MKWPKITRKLQTLQLEAALFALAYYIHAKMRNIGKVISVSIIYMVKRTLFAGDDALMIGTIRPKAKLFFDIGLTSESYDEYGTLNDGEWRKCRHFEVTIEDIEFQNISIWAGKRLDFSTTYEDMKHKGESGVVQLSGSQVFLDVGKSSKEQGILHIVAKDLFSVDIYIKEHYMHTTVGRQRLGVNPLTAPNQYFGSTLVGVDEIGLIPGINEEIAAYSDGLTKIGERQHIASRPETCSE